MLKQFRDFAMRGNVIDLAVAVVIGTAFNAIVTSLVNDIVMPILGAVTGGLDFSNYFIPLSKAVKATNLVDARRQGAVLAYGNFFTLVINFLIIAFALFLVVRGINQFSAKKAAEPPAPVAPPRSEVLLQEIRDLLANRAVAAE